MQKLNNRGSKNQFGLKSHEEFLQDFFERHQKANEYEFLEKYAGVNKKIRVKHINCGTEFLVRPNSLLQGSTCKMCQKKEQIEKCKNMGRKNIYSHEKYKKLFLEQSKNEYELLSEYKNSKTKIKIRCKKCNKIYEVLPTTFQHGYRCRKCSSDNRSTRVRLDAFKEKLKNLKPEKVDQYEIIEFSGLNEKITLKHNKCGTIFIMTRAKDLLYSNYEHCPKCKNQTVNCYSNFLTFIKTCGFTPYPEINNYCFLTEGRIEGCKNIKDLFFDVIFYKDGFVLGCIEFDGPQHEKPIYGEEKLIKQKESDLKKNEFCHKNNIPLLRIDYHEDDSTIKDLIYDFLSSTTKENKFFKIGKTKKFMSIVGSEVNADSKCK